MKLQLTYSSVSKTQTLKPILYLSLASTLLSLCSAVNSRHLFPLPPSLPPIGTGPVTPVTLSCTATSCLDPYLSRCKFVNTCGPCSVPTDCQHIDPSFSCLDSDETANPKVCGDCSSSIPCSGTNICKSYKCEPCAAHIECQNAFPTKPYCVPMSPGNKQCQECLDNTSCADPKKSRCSDVSYTCSACQAHDDCTHLGSSGASFVCFNNQCMSSSNLAITVSDTDSPDIYAVGFPVEIIANVDVLKVTDIGLENIEASIYSYKFVKITNTKYEIRFTVTQTVPRTTLRLTYTMPASTSYTSNFKTIWKAETQSKRMSFITEEQKQTVKTVETVAQVTTTAVTTVSGSMMLMGANPAILWALVNLLQTFYYLIFINVNYPANLQIFLKVFSLGGLDFIPNPITLLFPDIEENPLAVPDRFADYDVDGLFLNNAGNMLLIWVVTFLIYIIAAIGKKYLRSMFKLAKAAFTKVVTWFEWSGVLRALITSYPEITQAAFLQIRVLTFGSVVLSVSSVFGVIFTVFAVIFPVLVYHMIKKANKNPTLLTQKYSTLVEEYTLERDIPKYFTPILLVRRLLMNLTLIFLHNYPYAQISCLLILCVVFIGLLIKYKPYSTRRDNITNIVSEVLFLKIYSLLFVLVHDDNSSHYSEASRLKFGWVMIALCGLILAIGLGIAFYQQCIMIKEGWKLLKEFIRLHKEKTSKTKVHVDTSKDCIIRDSVLDASGITTENLSQSVIEMPVRTRQPKIKKIRTEAAARKLERLKEINFVV